eukprot:COSAG02_NODE_936_length_15800_cov_56.762945_7_plen_188_part_00
MKRFWRTFVTLAARKRHAELTDTAQMFPVIQEPIAEAPSLAPMQTGIDQRDDLKSDLMEHLKEQAVVQCAQSDAQYKAWKLQHAQMAADLVEKYERPQDSAYLLYFIYDLGRSQPDTRKYFDRKWKDAVTKSGDEVKTGPAGFTGKQSAKHSVKDLRKQASTIKKRECPATSTMKRKELIAYIEKHS